MAADNRIQAPFGRSGAVVSWKDAGMLLGLPDKGEQIVITDGDAAVRQGAEGACRPPSIAANGGSPAGGRHVDSNALLEACRSVLSLLDQCNHRAHRHLRRARAILSEAIIKEQLDRKEAGRSDGRS